MSTNEHWRALVGPWHHTLECLSAYKRSWPLMSAYECSVGLMSAQVLDSKINKICFNITYAYCLSNVSVNIWPNIKKVDILRVYTYRAVEKCTKWNFFTPRKLINPQNKTWVRFFFTNPLFLHWSLPLFENNFKWMVYKYCNFSIGPTFNY